MMLFSHCFCWGFLKINISDKKDTVVVRHSKVNNREHVGGQATSYDRGQNILCCEWAVEHAV